MDEIVLPVIVLGELLAGFAPGVREGENHAELAAFLDSARVRVAPVDDEATARCGEVYAALRRAGRPIPVNDSGSRRRPSGSACRCSPSTVTSTPSRD